MRRGGKDGRRWRALGLGDTMSAHQRRTPAQTAPGPPASPHRKEAFEACHHLVDRFKETVPIWKKEVWEGGEVWIEGEPVSEERR